MSVRLLYDWLGGLGKTPGRFWERMRRAGVEVRCCNPPRLASPLAWIRRDHRKLLCVDGELAFVSGLCVGQDWLGWPERGVDPWRDTGVAIRGPAVADVERAFADSFEWLETVATVESQRLWLGIGDDADTSEGVPLIQGQAQNVAEECPPDAVSLGTLVDGESRQSHDREGIGR